MCQVPDWCLVPDTLHLGARGCLDKLSGFLHNSASVSSLSSVSSQHGARERPGGGSEGAVDLLDRAHSHHQVIVSPGHLFVSNQDWTNAYSISCSCVSCLDCGL